MNKNISVIKLTMDFNPVHLDDAADWWHIKIETNKNTIWMIKIMLIIQIIIIILEVAADYDALISSCRSVKFSCSDCWSVFTGSVHVSCIAFKGVDLGEKLFIDKVSWMQWHKKCFSSGLSVETQDKCKKDTIGTHRCADSHKRTHVHTHDNYKKKGIVFLKMWFNIPKFFIYSTISTSVWTEPFIQIKVTESQQNLSWSLFHDDPKI